MSEKLYGCRDVREVEPHYSTHVMAMTSEGLHKKSDIAAELGYRDSLIEKLSGEGWVLSSDDAPDFRQRVIVDDGGFVSIGYRFTAPDDCEETGQVWWCVYDYRSGGDYDVRHVVRWRWLPVSVKGMGEITKLVRGSALVIYGPQGSGKTTLAVEIAKSRGSYKRCRDVDFETELDKGDVMRSEPDTVIVEELRLESLEKFKPLITEDLCQIHQKGLHPKMVSTPDFIFCTGNPEVLPLVHASRRFRVVDLSPDTSADDDKGASDG